MLQEQTIKICKVNHFMISKGKTLILSVDEEGIENVIAPKNL